MTGAYARGILDSRRVEHRLCDENTFLPSSPTGVRVTAVRDNGTIHDFVLLNALTDTPAVRGALQQANTALMAALHR
jgi:hypothetical protein